MNPKCSKCKTRPVVNGSGSKCPSCGTQLCATCAASEQHKCPSCGKRLIRVGGVEDKLKG